MTIFFLGFAVPPKQIVELQKSDKRPQVAANKLQFGIIDGLEGHSGQRFEILSSVPASNYPKNNRIFFRREPWSYMGGSNDVMMPFVNLFGIKQLTRFVSAYRELSLRLKNDRSEKKYLIVYSLHSPHLVAASLAARRNRCLLVVIVPDLPQFMNVDKRQAGIRSFLKRVENRIAVKYMKRADGIIPVADAIAQDFAPGVPSLTVEGITVASEMDRTGSDIVGERKIVIYAGGLREEYGVKLLVDGFRLTDDPNLELHIYGRGELAAYCENASAVDSRIVLHGFVQTTELAERQKAASLLVNPRLTGSDFARYSFPSKLLEYMASGRPVLTTRVPSIPGEYFRYVFAIDEETPEYVAQRLNEICTKPQAELDSIGRACRDFVADRKSPHAQGERIWRFLQDLDNRSERREQERGVSP